MVNTPNAQVFYTTDGSTPVTDGLVYVAAIDLDCGAITTIKAFAAAPTCVPSEVVSQTYVIECSGGGMLAAPTFAPPGGTYAGPLSVTISAATTGSVIHVTSDGSQPTPSSAVYTTPLDVTHTQQLRAMATAPGYSDSPISSATYTIEP